jgi:hypothetical protein
VRDIYIKGRKWAYITRGKICLFRGKWLCWTDRPVAAFVLVENASKDTGAIEVRETELFD